MDDKTRRKILAAPDCHRREVEAAQSAVDGVHDKCAKLTVLVAGAEASLKPAQDELRAAKARLDVAEKAAAEIDGPAVNDDPTNTTVGAGAAISEGGM